MMMNKRNLGGLRWRTERLGVFHLCKSLNGKVINMFPPEDSGDALVEIHGEKLFLECVSTYSHKDEGQIPILCSNFGSYSQRGMRLIFERLQHKINKCYADGRSLLLIFDHPYPVGRRTLAHNAARMRLYDLRLFPHVWLLELLTKSVIVVK